MTTRPIRRALGLLAAALAMAAPFAALRAEEAPPLSTGQVLYLPVYSHVYHGDLERNGKPTQTLVSTHVSIRNTDSALPIRVLYARYYDTGGKLVKDYVTAPRTLPPLGTLELFVPRTDESGGSGANFLIAWSAEGPANPPLVEGIHADLHSLRPFVFITAARPIRPH